MDQAVFHRALRAGTRASIRERLQLRAIVADIGDFVIHDQVMLGIHRRLDVVAHHSRAFPTGGYGACIGIGQRDMLIRGVVYSFRYPLHALHFGPQRVDLVLKFRCPGFGGITLRLTVGAFEF